MATSNKARVRKLQSFPNTDAGNAEAFELLQGDRFRFDYNKAKWLIWNGRYWVEDGEAVCAAIDLARRRSTGHLGFVLGKRKTKKTRRR
jgi:hypothetical protein